VTLRSTRARFAAVLPLLLMPLASCAERDLSWDIVFEPPALGDGVVRIDALIREGTCPGGDVLYEATVRPEAAGARSLPVLPEGDYCFSARAGDATCQWFAAGSTGARLPLDGDGPVRVTVVAQSPEANCPTTCSAGLCGPGGGEDCPAGRCLVTCGGVDACSRCCSGGACPMTCSVAADCTFRCSTGCAITCEGAASCSATCTGGGCAMACRDAADCVFDCPGGGCQFNCGPGATCTTTCAGGGCIGT